MCCMSIAAAAIGLRVLHVLHEQGRNQKFKIGEADSRGRYRILLRVVEVVEVTTQCANTL